MLTEKDYCDYETRNELIKLGYPAHLYDNTEVDKILGAVLLYEAQKFLREEKNIIVEANFNLMYKEQPRFEWRVLYNLTQHKGAYYTFDSVKSKGDYDSYEEALSEGVRASIKILQDEQKEND